MLRFHKGVLLIVTGGTAPDLAIQKPHDTRFFSVTID